MSKLNVGGGAVTGVAYETTVAVTPSANVALDCSLGGVFAWTPGEAEAVTASNVTNGERLAVVITTSGASSFTLTFGTGFVTTGTLATGTATAKIFVLTFVGAGGKLVEVSRTTAM